MRYCPYHLEQECFPSTASSIKMDGNDGPWELICSLEKKKKNIWKCWLFLGWAPCSLQRKSRKHLKKSGFSLTFSSGALTCPFSPGIVSNERNIKIDSQSYVLCNVIQLKESRRMKRMKILFCSTSTHLNIESSEYQARIHLHNRMSGSLWFLFFFVYWSTTFNLQTMPPGHIA